MQSLIELVSFKLINNTDETALNDLQPEMNEWIKQQTGFYYRTLVKDTDGSFLDIIHWASLEDAKKAGELIMQQPFMQQMMALIDKQSVNMRHIASTAEIGYDSNG